MRETCNLFLAMLVTEAPSSRRGGGNSSLLTFLVSLASGGSPRVTAVEATITHVEITYVRSKMSLFNNKLTMRISDNIFSISQRYDHT